MQEGRRNAVLSCTPTGQELIVGVGMCRGDRPTGVWQER